MRFYPRLATISPRFSLRTFAILVTLACLYFGAWEATKRYGVTPDAKLLSKFEAVHGTLPSALTPPTESSPMPLVIQRTHYGYFAANCDYYLWLFGLTIKLPFETELK